MITRFDVCLFQHFVVIGVGIELGIPILKTDFLAHLQMIGTNVANGGNANVFGIQALHKNPALAPCADHAAFHRTEISVAQCKGACRGQSGARF